MAKPLIAPTVGTRTSGFGPRKHPITGKVIQHNGVDISAPKGRPVLSPQSGTVTTVAFNNARGHYVVVRGGDGEFLVQHLGKVSVKQGAKVRLGQQLGTVGSTGASTGPHLHLEVKVKGVLVDPEKFFPQHGQPKPYVRPGEGVTMIPKFKSRHLLLKSYFEDRKKVAATRNAGFKVNTVLSTWKGWTITKANRYYATARLKKV